MRENPIYAIHFSAVRNASIPVFLTRGPRLGRAVAVACACAFGLGLGPVCEAQTFIRVPAPSVQQQNQDTVNAMPNPSNSAAANPGSAPQEAVLSETGRKVKMVDQNGKDIGNGGWSLFHGWRPTFYLNVNLGFDDNIFIQRHKTGDFITKIQPGIVLGWGDYREQLIRIGAFPHEYEIPTDELTDTKFFYVDYHPTFQIFASNTQENVVNESVLAAGSYQFSKLIVQGHLQYQTLSEVNTDVGGRINSTLYSGIVTGLYQVDDKTSLEEIVNSFSSQYDGKYQDSVNSNETTYLNYQVAPKTNVSAGLVLGYLAPENNSSELYEQLVGRVRWSESDKLYVYATGGLEVREEAGGTDEVDGVFDIEVNYAPFDGTRFLLSASRGTQGTADNVYEDTLITGVQLGVQQRLFGRLYASGSVAYSNLEYEYQSSTYRTDNLVTFKVGAGMDLTSYAGIQLAYQFLNNDSTLSYRTFDANSVIMSVDLLY